MATPTLSLQEEAGAPGGGVPELLFAPDARYTLRKARSRFMFWLVAAAALLGVSVLWIILAYVFIRGVAALDLAFFTQRPLPYGEVGGGVGPAIVGSLILMGVSSLIGVPIGVGAGIYLSEYGRGASPAPSASARTSSPGCRPSSSASSSGPGWCAPWWATSPAWPGRWPWP